MRVPAVSTYVHSRHALLFAISAGERLFQQVAPRFPSRFGIWFKPSIAHSSKHGLTCENTQIRRWRGAERGVSESRSITVVPHAVRARACRWAPYE
jgi:hypothetical protein